MLSKTLLRQFSDIKKCDFCVITISGSKLSGSIDDDISRVKNSIAQLYSVMNIEQHQLQHEQQLIDKINDLKAELEPYEMVEICGTNYVHCLYHLG